MSLNLRKKKKKLEILPREMMKERKKYVGHPLAKAVA